MTRFAETLHGSSGAPPQRSTRAAEAALARCVWLLQGLCEGGLRHVFVCPGNRSAPLALAAELHPTVEVSVVVDERAAAFMALGAARASGRPTAVVTTSGTGVANLFPAVVEAAMGGGALILLTADRPPWSRGTGANQTIFQTGIFGRYVRHFEETDVPGGIGSESGNQTVSEERWRWRSLGRRAALSAVAAGTGPVHVNLPFDEPLVPDSDVEKLARQELRALYRDEPEPIDHPERSVSMVAPGFGETPSRVAAQLAEEIGDSERVLVYVGALPVPAPEIVEAAELMGWPVYAEPLSGLRHMLGTLRAGWWLASSHTARADLAPETIVQIGRAPSSRPGLALLRGARRIVVVSADGRRQDPLRKASVEVYGDPASIFKELAKLARRRGGRRGSLGWHEAWRRADSEVASAVEEVLGGDAQMAGEVPDELTAMRATLQIFPEGSFVFLASSTPVRDADAVLTWRKELRFFGNRGASGIDGSVSTATGIWLGAGAQTPLCAAVVGDLATLHDLSGLQAASSLGARVVVVVFDNAGGGIFRRVLPRGLDERLMSKLFVAPQNCDLAQVVGAIGFDAIEVSSCRELGRLPQLGWSWTLQDGSTSKGRGRSVGLIAGERKPLALILKTSSQSTLNTVVRITDAVDRALSRI